MMKHILYILICITLTITSQAQINLWETADVSELAHRSNEPRYTNPTSYGLFKIQMNELRMALQRVPHEEQLAARNSYMQFSFPMPDGSFRTFNLVEYRMMEEGLARNYPHLKSYTGIDVKMGTKIHLNLTQNQLFAAVREKGVTYYIDPYFKEGNTYFVSYDIRNDLDDEMGFSCDQHKIKDGEVVEVDGPGSHHHSNQPTIERGEAFSLRTYRLAVSATAGFTAFYGGTVTGALDGITTIVNRINSVYEREVAIRMILIANNDQIIFTTPQDDPFDAIAVGDQAAFLGQNQSTLTTVIGNANYDIGHVFNVKASSPFGQGIAQRSSVCRSNSKGRGSSARMNPVGDAFTVSIICHEMGHQFSANHIMYHCHNVNLATSVEPGSGTTIMSYAGICSSTTDIQNFSDDYFNSNSIAVIQSYSRNGEGNSCGENIDLGNSYPDPILDYPPVTYIPVNTPFKLAGSAADSESSDGITYCWEQYDNGNRNYENNPWDVSRPMGNEPLFRSRPPVADSFRYFPALPIVVNSSNYLWEQLPDYARNMKFRMTVRDNASENGGAKWDEMDIQVIDNSNAGQFEITNYNVKDTLNSGDYVELTWNVAETDLSPIGATFVDIYMSTDGGSSFPHLVKEHTLNDGSAFVNIPNLTADRFRFMLAASENIFYDVTNRSGLLVQDTATEAIGLEYNDQYWQVCAPEVIEIEINSFGMGNYDGVVNYSFNGILPIGATASFAPEQTMVGEPTLLTVNLENAIEGGVFDMSFEASGDGVETRQRTIELDVTTNNFENLTLNLPSDGATAVEFFPMLAWNDVQDAIDYTVELSDQPDFSNIVFTRENLTTTQIAVDVQLASGTVYFWRILPRNNCALHNINNVAAFQVKALSCEEYCSTESSITLSASGTPTAEMVINTGASTTVNDLNITEIKGRHSDFGHLKFTLEGPDGTQVDLMGPNVCGYVNTNIDMGFDDDAVGVIPNCINFNDGLRFEPANPLSALNGQTGTEYKLILADVQSGSGGRLDGWCFEICGDADPEKPLLVRADSIEMQILDTRVIDESKLEVTHSQYAANELTITLIETPQAGTMLINGAPANAGSQLTMQDVQNGNLSYQHEENNAGLDHFSFIVTDPGGGFLGTPTILFYVGISSTREELPVGSELSIYPNPASNYLHLNLKSDHLKLEKATFFQLDGKLIRDINSGGSNSMSIDISTYPPGLYLIRIKSGDLIINRKFIKQ